MDWWIEVIKGRIMVLEGIMHNNFLHGDLLSELNNLCSVYSQLLKSWLSFFFPFLSWCLT